MQPKKIIVSLCDYSGNWPSYYREAGYEVVQIDLKHGDDVRDQHARRGPRNCAPRRPWDSRARSSSQIRSKSIRYRMNGELPSPSGRRADHSSSGGSRQQRGRRLKRPPRVPRGNPVRWHFSRPHVLPPAPSPFITHRRTT